MSRMIHEVVRIHTQNGVYRKKRLDSVSTPHIVLKQVYLQTEIRLHVRANNRADV